MREMSGWIVTASSGSPVLVFDPERLVHLPPDTPAGCPDTQAGDLGW